MGHSGNDEDDDNDENEPNLPLYEEHRQRRQDTTTHYALHIAQLDTLVYRKAIADDLDSYI